MTKDQSASPVKSTGAPTHVIRLHGPWQYEPLAVTRRDSSGEPVELPGDLPASGSIKIPADWAETLGRDFRGRVLYQRRFGRPSNLEPDERVDLVLHGINGRATITLNGRDLGVMEIAEPVSRFELTNLLLPRNQLHIEVNLPQGCDQFSAGGIVGEVHLEIYEVTR